MLFSSKKLFFLVFLGFVKTGDEHVHEGEDGCGRERAKGDTARAGDAGGVARGAGLRRAAVGFVALADGIDASTL